LVLTYYYPTRGYYGLIRITASDYLDASFQSGVIGHHGISGPISQQEKEGFLDQLASLEWSNTSWFSKDNFSSQGVIVTLSLKSQDGGHLIYTCRGQSCPEEVCSVFDLVDVVSEREGQPANNHCPFAK
jgi:hypothetical protein